MKRNIKDRLKIELDMTSLLDVIFIVLMIVMCQAMATAVGAESKLEDTARIEAELAEAQDALEMYESREQEILEVEDRVAFVTVYVDFEESDVKTRTIKLMYDESFEIEPIEITPSNEKIQYTAFENSLDNYLSSHRDKPVLLTLDEEKILYRDHEKVAEILDNLKNKHSNLYVQ